jgi:hypothetical protein
LQAAHDAGISRRMEAEISIEGFGKNSPRDDGDYYYP